MRLDYARVLWSGGPDRPVFGVTQTEGEPKTNA